MSIKILGGVAKNFILATPHNSSTRPTSVMLKRRLFDSVQNFENKIFIDLCSGSGSIGLEALSRGASEVYLIEQGHTAIKSLKKNIISIQNKYPELTQALVELKCDDFNKWMLRNIEKMNSQSREVFVFFDPPYEKLDLYKSFFNLKKSFTFNGRVIVEACQQKTSTLESFEQQFGKPDKVFKQGTSFFAIYDF